MEWAAWQVVIPQLTQGTYEQYSIQSRSMFSGMGGTSGHNNGQRHFDCVALAWVERVEGGAPLRARFQLVELTGRRVDSSEPEAATPLTARARRSSPLHKN
jgi:hypothetical protein